MPRVGGAAAALAGLLCALAPATANAAELAPLKPCYVSAASGETETVVISGSRFAPAVPVDILVDGVPRATAITDLGGNLAPTGVPAPRQPAAQRVFAIVAQERANPASRAEVTALVTDLELSVSPRRAAPSDRLRWTGSGFTAQREVYAHYVYRGRSQRTVLLARPSGRCGTFQVRRRQFPFRPRPGRWTVQVDQEPVYSLRPQSVNFRLRISVRRTRDADQREPLVPAERDDGVAPAAPRPLRPLQARLLAPLALR